MLWWIDTLIQIAIGLIGLSVIRRLVNRWLLKEDEHSFNVVLDWMLVGLILIGLIVAYFMKPDEELEAFSAVINRAYSDDRTAIDELYVIVETPNHRFRYRAQGVVDNITRTSIVFPTNSTLVERLRKLSYTDLLQHYRDMPQDSAFVFAAINHNTQMTEDEKARFFASMIEDHSFRVAQRACSAIRLPLLARFQQLEPIAYARLARKCQVYGKLWEALP
jgi:hypothetical protein